MNISQVIGNCKSFISHRRSLAFNGPGPLNTGIEDEVDWRPGMRVIEGYGLTGGHCCMGR